MKYLMEYLSNPELEAAMTWWSAFEQIHSYSYTYIIKNVYPNPSDIFDNILNDKEIVKRATSVTKYYNDLIKATKNPKKQLYLSLISINILEGIRFYVSFACSYCFAQNKKMEGNAKIISLINRDENLHLGMSQSIIRLLRTDESEGFVEIANQCEPIVYEMYEKAAEEEAEWAKYLFSKEGTGMLGLNDEILIRYMRWLTNRRLRGIGLKHIFDGTQNPIPWMNNWTESKSVQVAPQEAEIESYKSGSYIQDMEERDWAEEFKGMI
jgi:ribonucleoside-diphosphate reductase beta chain